MKIACKLLLLIVCLINPLAQADLLSLDTQSSPVVLEGELPLNSHLYWKYPGDFGKGLELDFSQSTNLLRHEILWPWPQAYVFEGKTSYVFPDKVRLPIHIWPIDELKPVNLKIKISGTICSEDACELYFQTITKSFKPQTANLKSRNDFSILKSSFQESGDLTIGLKFYHEEEEPRFMLGIQNLCLPTSAQEYSSGQWTLTWKLSKADYEKLAGKSAELFCDKMLVPKNISLPESASSNFVWSLIIFSLLGGLILNFMPCTLPVLSLKLLSLTKQNNKNATVFYILGIIATFNVVALCSIVLKEFGQSFGFGMQFQNPVFVIMMAIIMVVLVSYSLEKLEFNFFGALASRLNNVNMRQGYLFDFVSGAIAGVLSTSCSAPLLGVALGVALTSSAFMNLLIFNLIGLGFSGPYLLILFYPRIIDFIPRSGVWLNVMKRMISLFLILTLMWLLYLLYGQMSLRAFCGLLGLLVLIKMLIESKVRALYIPWLRAILFSGMCALCFYLPLQAWREDIKYEQMKDALWQEFSQQALSQALHEQKVVMVDVTADWCGTCQYNKALVLDRSWTVKMFVKNNVVLMRASLNRPNSEAVEFMQKHEIYAIPLNVVYGSGAPQGIVLPTTYGYKDLERAVDRAGRVSA